MNKNDAINTIKGFSEISDALIEKCADMVNEMVIVPYVRFIIDDDEFGMGVAFDYDENGFAVEIFVSDEEIWGYTSFEDEQGSNFAFENKTDAVNFWNVILGKFV